MNKIIIKNNIFVVNCRDFLSTFAAETNKTVMTMRKVLLTITALLAWMAADAQTLMTGGQFMDLLLPMEGGVAATGSDWGTTAGSNTDPKYAGTWEGTLGRWKDNGIEDATHSYWGGNIIKGDDGKYHIYVSGWSSVDYGHMAWSSASRVYHIKSDNVWGPYEYVNDIGPGHNSEIYKTGDTYVIYHIEPLGIYTSTTLGDSWTSGEFLYDKRDRILIAGENTETSLSNCSFAKREDGSFVMIDRGGGIWVSQNGLSDPWHQLTDKSVYLNSEIKNRGYLEDPVIWRDHLQYHMIVNDWNARYAYYYRSLDGLNWVKEAGKAYCGADDFAKHSNGDAEKWHKYERPRVYQDEQGRAIRMNFAVIDCVKQSDLGGDTHSSKNINMPLTKQLLLEIQTINSTTATVLVKAEDGFNPKTDLNFSSLKFGSHDKVNYGNGFSYSSYTESGDDIIITFTGSAGSINDGEWAPKMLGQKTDGSIAFGYAKMPAVDYKPAMLSAVTPAIAADGTVQSVSVTNYGQSASTATTVRVYNQAGNTLLAHGTTSALAAYGDETVTLTKDAAAAAGYTSIQVRFYNGETLLNTENIPLTTINAAQAALQTVIDEAQTLYDDESLTNGKSALKTAIDNAKHVVTCYNISAIEAEQSTLATAMNTFKYANASLTRGMSITIPNGTCDDLSEWTMTRLDADNAPGWKTSTKGGDYNGFDGNFIETWVSQSNALGVANRASQTLTDMPAGRYRLRANVIACRQNNASATTGVTLFANSQTTACKTANNTPQEFMVEINMAEAGSLTIGIDIPSTTEANWVALDNVTLKYFGTEEGEIIEDPLTFDYSKVYYIKWKTNSYSKIYWRSPKFNSANDPNLHRTANENEAAKFIIRSVSGTYGQFYLYDIVSHTYVVPSTNNSNGTIWSTSTTQLGKVAIAEATDYYTITSMAGGEANAYGNDNNDGDVKNYSGGSQWLIEEAGDNTTVMGINPQAVYQLKHLNTSRNRYMAAEPNANGYLLTTNTDANKGKFSLLPVSGQEGYYYIFNNEGYFMTPSTTYWTLSKSTPAAVKVELNIDRMATNNTFYATFLLGEEAQHANPQNKNSTELVYAYSAHETDNGNNWMLEPVSDATASLSLNNITSSLSSIVASANASDVTLTYTATVTSAGFGTLVVPFEADVEGDVEAWELTSIDGSSRIQGTKVTTIEANKPVLLKNKGILELTAKSGTAAYSASPSHGLLHGTYTQGTVSAGNYVLQNIDNEVAFYKVDSDKPTINPFRAYLTAPVTARMLTFLFDNETTGVADVRGKMSDGKGEYFNMQGQRVAQPTKGIYIINGKKTIIK